MFFYHIHLKLVNNCEIIPIEQLKFSQVQIVDKIYNSTVFENPFIKSFKRI